MTEAIITLKPAVTARHGDSWKLRGTCKTVDPELFFPEKGGSVTEAKRICTGCPVRAECLDFALRNNERFGVWGGLSERERLRLRHGDRESQPIAS
jgi:WhiB family redox-sensing transcriptional regulator